MSIEVIKVNYTAGGNGQLEVIVEGTATPTIKINDASANVVSAGRNKWKAVKSGPFTPGEQKIEAEVPNTAKSQTVRFPVNPGASNSLEFVNEDAATDTARTG